MAEGNIQQSMGDSSPEIRDESKKTKRKEEINNLQRKNNDGKESTEQSIKKMEDFLTSMDKIIRENEMERVQSASKKTTSVTFAIKAANEDMVIENQIIEYIKNVICGEKMKIKTDFNWENKKPTSPLVVFCNYSSRIGVDVEMSLRGVQEPKVILIILHYIRSALIKGDLSDDDYLLPDSLKDRTVCIAHFAFDDKFYDCEQNKQTRKRLCDDFRSHHKIAINEGK